MFTFILAIHIIVAIALSGLILIQHGKGADAGASFGSGAAGTVFGAAGSANFLTRTTAILATIFFCTSLALGYHAQQEARDQLRLDVPVADTSTPAKTP
ncbi:MULTISPECIES: preprotein translocase subunit SecG [Moraxella]|jgi:preprotein translocase, secG subunit|uniref:Protein-export membrane protein SecG n=1 Tax=Moraxella lacunata TaxID=477 RepID=A0A1B8Q827_MORLA|nr:MULTISPECIES: preprotein translocase subunit SecG [Moraxella]MBE9579927.1 preprotein translocase subunit SecG [Moraxella sp. K1664]MBE9589314.1 preprotein translocase subunit SecG [Moraxella sp. K1630]MBE9597575.1 preprotein translocase subunit SecG [Moraxella sp. K2450]MDH9220072.1 preprotein translocase subunit SecG [Moraxella lacunata]MDI4484080.1 preprotein translocase subunit SecG [Moraxella lacunata]